MNYAAMGARQMIMPKIIQIQAISFPASSNNGDCSMLIALCEDGSLWQQWHSFGFANVPTDERWRKISLATAVANA